MRYVAGSVPKTASCYGCEKQRYNLIVLFRIEKMCLKDSLQLDFSNTFFWSSFIFASSALPGNDKMPRSYRIVLIFCHADLRIFPHLWNQILHQRLFQPRPDVRFLFHDTASENHRLRVCHITDIGDSKCQNIDQPVDFFRTDPIAFSGVLIFPSAITLCFTPARIFCRISKSFSSMRSF